MKDSGRITKLTEKEPSGMSMVTSTKEIGNAIRHMDMESILTVTELPMKAIGEMIFNTAKVSSSGMIIRNTKVNIREAKNMDMEPIPGKMDPNILESGSKIRFTDVENTPGMMVVNTKVTGETITWMVMAFTLGKMAGSTKVSTRRIRNMAKVFTHGPMVASTTASGKMEGKMVVENTYPNKASIEKESGRMEREKNGWTRIETQRCEGPIQLVFNKQQLCLQPYYIEVVCFRRS